MKKLFISQPMVNKPDSEILAIREKAIEFVEKQLGEEVELIDSFVADAPKNAKPLWYLGKSLQFLSEADIAYFAKDWEKYRGCKMEHDAAIAYGVPRIEGVY